jgi:ATP-dependent DNA helicase RecG
LYHGHPISAIKFQSRTIFGLIGQRAEDGITATAEGRLGLVEANGEARHPTVAGILLLGKEESLRQHLPTHEVAFQVLRHGQVEVNDFFRVPLVKISEMVYERFRARVQEQELMLGMLRVGIPDYAPSAFREAVHNALIHRNYSRLGAVHIQWYEDHIEISSPGGFVEGVRLDNLLTVPPTPRNPRLADAFKRVGLVERTGRGIDTIFEGQLRNGRPAPDYSRSTDAAVVVVLPGGAASLEFARFVIEQERAGRPLSLDGLLILNEIYRERRIDLARAMELTQKPATPVRASLEHLVELGLIEARGEKKGRVYHFSPAVYRALGMSSAYVRTRGLEPIQVEARVYQFVQAHGKITRAEAAELCHLSEPQAYRLLKGLAERGLLKQVGRGRKSYYERAERTHG